MPRKKAVPKELPKGLSKRGDIYWTAVAGPSKKIARASTGTGDFDTALAKLAERRLAAWRVKHDGESPKVALTTALNDWLIGWSKVEKDTYGDDLLRVKVMLPLFDDINIDEIRTPWLQLLHDKIREKRKVKGATANRYLEIISATLHWHKERDLGGLTNVPSMPYAEEKKHRVVKRPLTVPQVQALFRELPLHLNRALRFSLATGLRDANVRRMEWSRINLTKRHAYVEGEEAKGEDAIPVPLSGDAVVVLQEVLGEHERWCFTYEGQPITNKMNNTAFKNAKMRAGIPHCTVHLLRHTWASFHAMNGTPIPVLQEMGAWKSRAMVEVYAHLAPGFTAKYANNGIEIGTVGLHKNCTVEVEEDEKLPQVLDSLGWLEGIEPSTAGITTLENVIVLHPNQALTEEEIVHLSPGTGTGTAQ